MKNNKIIIWWFFSSVWIVIGENLYRAISNFQHANEIVDAYPGGYDIKVLLGPSILLVFELFLWFKMFRHLNPPSRIFAGVVGLYIWLMIILVNIIVADMYDRDLATQIIYLYVYAGTGHLVYAFFGKENYY